MHELYYAYTALNVDFLQWHNNIGTVRLLQVQSLNNKQLQEKGPFWALCLLYDIVACKRVWSSYTIIIIVSVRSNKYTHYKLPRIVMIELALVVFHT